MLLQELSPSTFNPARSTPVEQLPLHEVRLNCSEFLVDSVGMPLYKLQPAGIPPIKRVKVRQRKPNGVVTELFNSAFGDVARGIRQRSIISSPLPYQLTENCTQCYVFPTNAFAFLYSKTVTDSATQYDSLYETLTTNMEESTEAASVIIDLLQSTYTAESLVDGIMSGSEIILYNIPAYYSVRVDNFRNYDQLYDAILSAK
jgi:hypothetical protein